MATGSRLSASQTIPPSAMRLPRVAVFFACLFPLAWMAWQGLYTADGLGANPIEEITHRTGDWTLRFLLLTLLASPLRRITGWEWPFRLRRMLGLYAFFYGTLHLFTYLWLDQFFDWMQIVKDIYKRPFINVGFISYVLMIPLALTSTAGMMRRMGVQWARLHRAIYVTAILGVLHYWWLVKADVRDPAFYAALLALLLGLRVYWMLRWKLRG